MQGEYRIIRVDGSEEILKRKVPLRELEKLIGAKMLDSVNLRDGHVMMVDDAGVYDGKPINPTATILYHRICRIGTIAPICGDVAIVWDEDYA
jgi:hypothetical protein